MHRIKSCIIHLVTLIAFISVSDSFSAETVQHKLPATELSPCAIVIFGATGDLTAKKLLPALYRLHTQQHLSPQTAVVAFARREQSQEAFRNYCKGLVVPAAENTDETLDSWSPFEQKLFYNASDFEDDAGYESLKSLLKQIDEQSGTRGNRLYFLATQPSNFSTIVEKLHAHGLLAEAEGVWSRVVLEKPFGTDLESALHLQQTLTNSIDDSQIYRVDHYLAKEGLQNLLAMRFENGWLEPLWDNRSIDNVQITMSEDIGIGTRAKLWEETGTLRDVFQNHLLQMVALVAMEPPASLTAEAIHREKIQALQSLRAIAPEKVHETFIRGQYSSGTVRGKEVPGYHEEDQVSPQSSSETFVAAKLFIDTKRWAGVPFYIRGGKRLHKQYTEIAVTFKPSPLSSSGTGNILFIRVQPNAGIYINTHSRVPSLTTLLAPLLFGFVPENSFRLQAPDAYEKLFYDAIKGDATLFVDSEEQLAAWRFLGPVINAWKDAPLHNLYSYPAGSRGPEQSDRLFDGTGHQWQYLDNHLF